MTVRALGGGDGRTRATSIRRSLSASWFPAFTGAKARPGGGGEGVEKEAKEKAATTATCFVGGGSLLRRASSPVATTATW